MTSLLLITKCLWDCQQLPYVSNIGIDLAGQLKEQDNIILFIEQLDMLLIDNNHI